MTAMAIADDAVDLKLQLISNAPLRIQLRIRVQFDNGNQFHSPL